MDVSFFGFYYISHIEIYSYSKLHDKLKIPMIYNMQMLAHIELQYCYYIILLYILSWIFFTFSFVFFFVLNVALFHLQVRVKLIQPINKKKSCLNMKEGSHKLDRCVRSSSKRHKKRLIIVLVTWILDWQSLFLCSLYI